MDASSAVRRGGGFMKSSFNITKARAALHASFAGRIDNNGYVRLPEENLLPGVRMDQFEDDLSRGDGNELRMKFCAVHSSSALTINCFARFKDAPQELRLFGQTGAENLCFEKQLKIFPHSRPANLDVWIERRDDIIAVESKLLEYFTPKKAVFSEKYDDLAPAAEPSWWAVYKEAKYGPAQHLDCAQLIKHYFGLRKFQLNNGSAPNLTLFYIFWEPLNWQDIAECRRHRDEVTAFGKAVEDSDISFRWLPYTELWEEWRADPALAQHAQNLKMRYDVRA